jgi:modification methylase
MTIKPSSHLNNMPLNYRIPEKSKVPGDLLDQIMESDALEALKKVPDNCISLAITSPPYWNVKDYEHEKQIGQTSYTDYLKDLLLVWRETERVLIPNGKFALVTPIMPISKSVNNENHTRELKNINNDIEYTILNGTKLQRYSLFVWQKQTSEKMFGSYPFPPNIYEDNTIEFINIFVKPGKPPFISKEAKEESKFNQEEWRNLTMQVWPIYPADVKRLEGHPAPFPVVLPLRLIMMYSFKRDDTANFGGDIVLDMFNGTGTTCLAAKAAGRRFIGIDLNGKYCEYARNRLISETVNPYNILLDRIKVKNPKDSRDISLFKGE